MTRDLLIRGGTVVDPAHGRDGAFDVLLRDGRVEAVDAPLPADGALVFDAGGLLVFPGFIDLHVHLREPGREDAETIASGAAADHAEHREIGVAFRAAGQHIAGVNPRPPRVFEFDD